MTRNALRSPDNLRPDNKTVEMVGKRYGNLTVIALAGRKDLGRLSYHDGHRVRILLVLCKCDCGNLWTTPAYQVRQGRTRRCDECRQERSADYNRKHLSVKLPNGETIGTVALASGIDLDTVYHRWLRGWPMDRLGDPKYPKRTGRHGVGKSYYVEKRRRRVYKKRRAA